MILECLVKKIKQEIKLKDRKKNGELDIRRSMVNLEIYCQIENQDEKVLSILD